MTTPSIIQVGSAHESVLRTIIFDMMGYFYNNQMDLHLSKVNQLIELNYNVPDVWSPMDAWGQFLALNTNYVTNKQRKFIF